MFLFEGINDIKAHSGVTVDDLTAGYRADHRPGARGGTCVVGATVLPVQGLVGVRSAGEAVRQGVNEWIRHSGALDAVADFDQILRSPYNPQRLLPIFDGGDHLHPNDKGMQAMADSVDLTALRCAR